MKLILWDIDGTLLCSGHAGERALMNAMKICFSVDATLEQIDYFGRTDVLISQMLFDHYNVGRTPENQRLYLETYLQELRRELPLGTAKTHPGILDLLEEVKRRPNLAQGLLTGNLERGAQIKLEHFSVWHYFEFGAFSEDSSNRNDLGPFALRRAHRKTGHAFAPTDVFIVGDTPHDIACAKAIGAHSIAVATGHFTRAQLQEHGATALLDDLSDAAEFFAIIEAA